MGDAQNTPPPQRYSSLPSYASAPHQQAHLALPTSYPASFSHVAPLARQSSSPPYASPPPPPPPPPPPLNSGSAVGSGEISLSNGAWIGSTPPASQQAWSHGDKFPPFSSLTPPPMPSQFRSGAHVSAPLAPPTFTTPPNPASIPGSVFAQIPVAGMNNARMTNSLLKQNAVDHNEPHQTQLDSLDSSSWSAASSYVLFSAHQVLKEKKAFNIPGLVFGALICPGREVIPSPPSVRHQAFPCENCGAFSNLYCSIEPTTGRWKCSFCSKMNSSLGEYRAASKEDLQNWPELVTSVVDYVEVNTRRPGFMPVSDTIMAAPLLILIDASLDDTQLQHLQSSLHGLLDALQPATRVGIITYGKIVSVYDFSQLGIAAADVFPGDQLLDQELQKALLYGTGVYLAPLHACLGVAQNIVSSLRPYAGKIPEVARDRCIGTAVEIALSIIQGPSTDIPRSMVKRAGGCSRILVCAGGPNTYGQGSVPYSQAHPNYKYLENKAIKQMEQLGQEARRQDAVIDILCAGTCPVRVPVVQLLATASGGMFVLHDDFGETFGLNLQRAAKRTSGFRGMFEARFSDCFKPIHVIGPGKEPSSDARETARHDRSVAMVVPSLEECQSFSLLLELSKDIKEEDVYFQFSIHYTNSHQMNVTRVITIRLPTTSSVSSYAKSIDEEVAAVLIGKRIVAFAKEPSDALDMRTTIDERLKQIALKMGQQLKNSRLRAFPSELPKLAEILFHLRRGPLLGGIIGHEDERMVLRNIYLQASFDMALRMLAPRVLMHREGGTFEELPAYNLAMQSDAAIVLDHGTDIFIWMGLDLAYDETLSAAALAACRTLVEELTEQRFPAPRVLCFKEGTSQARYLQARLIPVHKDPPYEQEARFPQLRTLSTERRANLKSKFYHMDDLSFCEWMRSLKLIPSGPC